MTQPLLAQSLLAKRLFDISASALGLLVLSPLLALLALWVKCDSAGPVFFRQERVGLRGKPFRIYKFRSMRVDNAGLQITVGEDSRITRSGRFIRAYKLDELPQLLNVLTGDMSIVGPRPEVPRYVALYPEEARRLILSVRPGITDRAAIGFRDEERLLADSDNPERTYVEQIMPVKQRLYLDYVARHSVAGDVAILLQTVRAILRRH